MSTDRLPEHLPSQRARPLVVRCGAFGDMVIVLPLIAALHRRLGVPVDVLTSGAWSEVLLRGQVGVGDVFTVGSRRTPVLLSSVQRRVADAIRQRDPGPAWLCDRGSWGPTMLRRCGFSRERITVAGRDCPAEPGELHIDRWLRFAGKTPVAFERVLPSLSLSAVADLRSPPLRVLPAWRQDVDEWLRAKGITGHPLVLVQAGNRRTTHCWAPRERASNTKFWPAERWTEVIRAILADNEHCAVALLGVPAEASLNSEIANLIGSPRVVNAAMELPIPRLLALQERAIGMISVDTGPAHSAAALDCPLVVLFGEARVERYRPRSPSGNVEALVGPVGRGPRILGIGVQDVLGAWQRLPKKNVMSDVPPSAAAMRAPST